MTKALALTIVVVATASLAEGWGPRASAFQKQQEAERKRLGLDLGKAKKTYPTPEVTFGEAAGWACPGETTTILLEGKLSPGTLVGTSAAGVEIVKEEFTPKGWLGTFAVKPGTKGPVRLEFIAPVSGIRSDLELPLGCPQEWVFDLKGGDRLVLKVVDGENNARGEWFKGGKSVETRGFNVMTDGKTLNVGQRESAEDKERARKAQEPLKAKGLVERQTELTTKMQGCTSMPTAQMGACMQKYSTELQQLMAEQQGAMQSAQAAAAPKVGCLQLQGTIEAKKLKGTGSYCAEKQGFDAVPFTGLIK